MAITSPTDIAGLRGLYDASNTASITKSGSFWTRWNDLSGEGNDQGMTNTTFSPSDGGTLDGVTVCAFGVGGSKFMTLDPAHGGGFLSPAHTAATLTWFGVVRLDSTSEAYGRVCAFVNGAGDTNYASDSFMAIARNGAAGTFPVTYRNINHLDSGIVPTAGVTWQRQMVRCTGTTAEIYVDGVLEDSVSDSRSFNFQDYVSGYLTEGGVFSVAEHGWYSTSLTSGNLTDLDAYMHFKWLGGPDPGGQTLPPDDRTGIPASVMRPLTAVPPYR